LKPSYEFEIDRIALSYLSLQIAFSFGFGCNFFILGTVATMMAAKIGLQTLCLVLYLYLYCALDLVFNRYILERAGVSHLN